MFSERVKTGLDCLGRRAFRAWVRASSDVQRAAARIAAGTLTKLRLYSPPNLL